MNKPTIDELLAVLAYAALLGAALFLISILSPGCGSNIPVDPECGVLFEAQDEEAATFDCVRPDCDEEGAYNEGYSDGQDSVTCEECPEPEVVRECFKKSWVCRDKKTRERCHEGWWNKTCGWELVEFDCPVAHLDDDPIGCDPDLGPCPVPQDTCCRTERFGPPLGREGITVCEDSHAHA